MIIYTIPMILSGDKPILRGQGGPPGQEHGLGPCKELDLVKWDPVRLGKASLPVIRNARLGGIRIGGGDKDL